MKGMRVLGFERLGNIFKTKEILFINKTKTNLNSLKFKTIKYKAANITFDGHSSFFFGQNSIEGVLQVGGIRFRASDHQEAHYHHSRA